LKKNYSNNYYSFLIKDQHFQKVFILIKIFSIFIKNKMDYLKYKTIKLHNDYKNRKKILNDTFHNAYTECSEKTAPTYASEGLRSRSGKFYKNNFLEFKKNNLNTLSNCGSNRFNEVDQITHNKYYTNNYNNNEFETYNNNITAKNYESNLNNNKNFRNNNIQNCQNNFKGNNNENIICFKNENENNNNYYFDDRINNFEKTKIKIDEYLEEKNRMKNMKKSSFF